MPKNPAFKRNDTRREERGFKYSIEREIFVAVMRIWSQYPPLVSPKDVSCGLTPYDVMLNSNLVTGHTVLEGKSDEGHISQEPQASGWP